jgi:hypothetical protein
LKQSEVNPSQDSDTSVTFPEEINRTHRRPADLRRIWDYFTFFISIYLSLFHRIFEDCNHSEIADRICNLFVEVPEYDCRRLKNFPANNIKILHRHKS